MPKIVRFYRVGGPEVLQLEEVPVPQPQTGEVRVKVEAIGVNRAEVLYRTGNYLIEPNLPSLIGYEAAGIVEELGPGVIDLAPGDRVSSIPSFLMHHYGTYGEVAILPAHSLVKYPQHLSPAEGASIWMQYLMAFELLECGDVQPSDYVLITAASSSVGIAAIQLINHIGAVPIAATRSEEKEEALRSIGAKLVVNTATDNWVDQIRVFTDQRGVDQVFDAVAGPDFQKLIWCVCPRGKILVYGALAAQPTPLPLAPLIPNNLRIQGCSLLSLVQDSERFARAKQWVYQRVNNRQLTPVIAKTFPLAEVVDAHRYLESCQQIGKVVLQV
jgi:NADPH:quinone reductase-like Zn-dependent oxidoreductase